MGVIWSYDGKHPNLLEISMGFSDGKIMGWSKPKLVLLSEFANMSSHAPVFHGPTKWGWSATKKVPKEVLVVNWTFFKHHRHLYVGNKSFVSYVLVTSNSIVLVSYWLNMTQAYCQSDPHRFSCPPQWRHLFPPTDFSPLASAEVPTKCPKSFPGLIIVVSENVPLMMSGSCGTCFFLFFLQAFQGLLPGFMSALTACSAQKQWQRALCLYETLEGGLAWREVSMNLGHTSKENEHDATTCTKPHWIWEGFHKCCQTKDVSRHICMLYIYIEYYIVLFCLNMCGIPPKSYVADSHFQSQPGHWDLGWTCQNH